MNRYWLSSRKMTVGVTVNRHTLISDAAPVARRFIGQPFANLKRWMSGHGGLRIEELTQADEAGKVK